jgi:hypothetical protein
MRMIERSPYTLNAGQLENAVQALQKAAETLRPTPSEERLYRVLGICVRVAGAALAGATLAAFLLGGVVGWTGGTETEFDDVFGWTRGTETALDDVLLLLLFVFALLFFLAAIGAAVFLLLNQSVIRQAFRQRQLLKKLGIRDVSLSAWRLQRRGHRWSRLASTVLTWSGILSLVAGVVEAIGMWEGSKELSVWRWLEGPAWCGMYFAFGVTVLVWRFAQRSREQWAIVADANRLRSALESMQTKAGAGEAVTVPAAVLEDVARIERVQIARERRDAVVASAGATNRGYGVLVARDLLPQKALLDSQQRVAVEDLFENLSSNPRPPGVEPTPEGLLSVTTPKGGVELQYSVDDEAKRVNIVALTAHKDG